ncbi:hypothetical protein V8G54_003643 [Vigna mungo]|uniref:Uncharacterized protein n=1 Tax=Vigna mungo TaxID=3915 RepID=A0AAQ3SEC6_VIGMU
MGQNLLLLSESFICNIIQVEQQGGIRGQFHVPLPPSCHQHHRNLRQGTPHQFLEAVPPCTRQEHRKCHQNSTHTYPITPIPPYVILNVHQNGNCCQSPQTYEEHEPVEEFYHLIFLPFV